MYRSLLVRVKTLKLCVILRFCQNYIIVVYLLYRTRVVEDQVLYYFKLSGSLRLSKYLESHVSSVRFHHGMTRLPVAVVADGLQIWRVDENILNKQYKTADNG